MDWQLTLQSSRRVGADASDDLLNPVADNY
jgi:hypothetical protein